MAVCRRTVIRAAGGVSLALIGAGGVFAVTRTPDQALKPWADIDGPAVPDVRLDAFRHAILAPNPHNRQPWLIRLVGNDEAIISCDLARRLPETDPFDRQILIGFGCFFELARIAAAERGVRIEITPFPDGAPDELGRLDQRPVARLRFAADTAAWRDPLFAAIAQRRSAKQPFDVARPVDRPALDRLAGVRMPPLQTGVTNDSALVAKLRALTWEAWDIEFQTQRTWMESVNLMRIGKAEIEASPDGIALSGAMIEGLALAGQISRGELGRPGTAAYKSSRERYQPIINTGMAYAWITTTGNGRAEQLAAGRAYVRMNLEAAQSGLGFHPVSQALQEFPEMKSSFAAVHAALNADPVRSRVQMLVRLGYGTPVSKTPRWPITSLIVPG
jgi:hypothetical protein